MLKISEKYGTLGYTISLGTIAEICLYEFARVCMEISRGQLTGKSRPK